MDIVVFKIYAKRYTELEKGAIVQGVYEALPLARAIQQYSTKN